MKQKVVNSVLVRPTQCTLQNKSFQFKDSFVIKISLITVAVNKTKNQ
mgnify:CR=1